MNGEVSGKAGIKGLKAMGVVYERIMWLNVSFNQPVKGRKEGHRMQDWQQKLQLNTNFRKYEWEMIENDLKLDHWSKTIKYDWETTKWPNWQMW